MSTAASTLNEFDPSTHDKQGELPATPVAIDVRNVTQKQEEVNEEHIKPGVKPHVFKSRLQVTFFVVSIMLGQAFNLTPFGAQLANMHVIARHLGVDGNAGQIGWICAGFSLTAGSFVLVGGRLGDVYGHRSIWLASLVWSAIFNLISGFAKSPAFYDTMRGLTGIAAGMMLPVSVALLGTAFPPGRSRSLAFGLFGALAPFSAAGGSIFEALLGQFVPNAGWIWWLHSIKNVLTFAVGWYGIPTGLTHGGGGQVDWLGAGLGVSGLILFNFAFNQSVLAGWSAPEVIATLVIGLLLIVLFSIWEAKFAKSPILPFNIWSVPTFGAMMLSALLAFMSFGLFVFYYYVFVFTTRPGSTPTQMTAWFTPFTVLAFAAALLSAFLVSRVPAEMILMAGCLCLFVASTLLFTARTAGTYWTNLMFDPAFAAFGPDLVFTAAQIIASNSVKSEQQGVAGSLVGTCLNYGMALGIGFGGIVEGHTNKGGSDAVAGIRGALYLGAGLAGLGMLVVLFFVRVPRDERAGRKAEVEDVQKEAV